MSMQLEGKSIVVMGGGSGVGRATSLRFAEEGAKVVVADVDLDRAKGTVQLIEEAGGTALADQCDVSQEADVEATIALAVSNFGRLDIIFNNVGRADAAPRAHLRGAHQRRLRPALRHQRQGRVQRFASTRSSSSRPRVTVA